MSIMAIFLKNKEISAKEYYKRLAVLKSKYNITDYKPKGDEDEEKKAAKILEDYQKKYEQVRNKILEIRKQLNQAELTEEEKQRQAIIDKYDEQLDVVDNFILEIEAGAKKRGFINVQEYDLLQKFYNQKLELTQAGEQELLNLEQKFAKEKEKLRKDNEAKLLKERQNAQKQIDEQLADADTREVLAVIDKYKKLIELADKYGIDTKALYQKMHQEIRDIQEGIKGDDVNFLGVDWDKLKEDFDKLSVYTNQAKSLAESYFNYLSQKEQASLQAFEYTNEKKKSSLDKRLKSGLISQQKYDTEVTKLDKALPQRYPLAVL